MENLRKKLMLGGSMAAMLAAISATAQAQDSPQTEAVEVSASRINIQGYTAPTPVTVIGAEQLNRDAKVDIGDAIRELPAVGQSDSPSNGSHSGNASQGDAGIDTIDLRSLGVVRTLVLFDGQRVVTSNPNAGGPPAIGGVDLSTIPTSVIERVDVVTGVASAAWGSDAVAGVVNLVINKTYTGFKANAVFGNDKYDDHKFFGPGRLAPCRMPACLDADIRPSFLPGYVVGFAFGGGEFSSPVFLSVGIFAPWVCFIAFNWGEAVKLPPTLPPMTWKLDKSAGVTQY